MPFEYAVSTLSAPYQLIPYSCPTSALIVLYLARPRGARVAHSDPYKVPISLHVRETPQHVRCSEDGLHEAVAGGGGRAAVACSIA